MKCNSLNILSVYFVVCHVLLCSCKQNEFIKYTYYDTGTVKSKVVYQDKNDTSSFQAYIYYENGNLSHQAQFSKGKRTGRYLSYHKNGVLKESYQYKNGRLHGVIKRFTDTGEQIEESFYINGEHILIRTFSVNPEFNLSRSQIYLVKGNEIEEIGVLLYDKEKKIIENGSFFYETYGPEIIECNQETEFYIKFFNKQKDFVLELQIGDLDKNLNFIHPNEVVKYCTKQDSLPYSYIVKKSGSNLIMGKLLLRKDSIQLEYPYYFETTARSSMKPNGLRFFSSSNK